MSGFFSATAKSFALGYRTGWKYGYFHSPWTTKGAQKNGDDQRGCFSISNWARRNA